MTEPPARDEAFEALWARVLENWTEPKTHGALLEYAITKQCLPEVAGRYRALKDDPEKGEIAKKRLDGVVVAATQLLMSTATPRTKPRGPTVVTILAVVVSFALITWLARAVLGH